MPPRRRAQSTAATGKATDGRSRTLVAAASVLSGRRIERGLRAPRADRYWQAEAWNLYSEIPELHFYASWIAGSLSRVTLHVARPAEAGDPEVIEDGPAAEALSDFAGGSEGQAELLFRVGVHLAIAGESYLIAREDPDGATILRAYSAEEVSYSHGTWTIDDGDEKIKLGPDDLIIRVWQPSPIRYGLADSAVRSALPILRELRGLTMAISAEIDSRLAGAGLLLLPQSMTFPASPNADAAEGEDPFVEALMDAMITPIKDRDSAAAVVPIIAKVPDETTGKAQHIRFGMELSAQSKDLRDEAIRRLSLGLDIPPEILLGQGDTNHWTSWNIDENAVRLFIAPLAALVAHALTIGWLRPAMTESGMAGADELLIWPDLTDLIVRPDRSGAARELYDRAELSPEALRRENGFDETDAPTDEERTRILITRIAEADPLALLPLLGITPTQTGEPTGTPEAEPPSPEGRALPAAPQPEAIAASAADATEIAAQVAVHRALEVAGKRLLTRERRGSYDDIPAHLLHTRLPVGEDDLDRLLDSAWACIEYAIPERARCLVPVIDDYVRDLLRSGTAHRDEYLHAVLQRSAGELAHCA